MSFLILPLNEVYKRRALRCNDSQSLFIKKNKHFVSSQCLLQHKYVKKVNKFEKQQNVNKTAIVLYVHDYANKTLARKITS